MRARPFRQVVILVLLSLSFYSLTGSGIAASIGDGDPIRVFVSILPEEYFVARIGGNRVRVEALVQPGYSPATYSPSPMQMARLSRAQLYFRIGVPFENGLLPKIARTIPDLKIIDLRQGIDLLPMQEGHGEHGEYEGELDPHTWLDPALAQRQAALIRDTLCATDPPGAEEYKNNFASLAADLRELDHTLREVLKPLAGSTIYVFHPAYGYFCRAYHLKQKAILQEGKVPGARHLARLIAEAKRDRVRVIFVQPQFSTTTAATIARAVDGRVVALDPLARDYLANMKSIAAQLTENLPPANH